MCYNVFITYGGIDMVQNLDDIEGVGPKTLSNLQKLNINSVDDLINYYPYRYDVLKRTDMDQVADGAKVIMDGIIEGQPTLINISSSLKKFIFRISNKRNIFNITIYNQTYLQSELKCGKSIIVFGKYNRIKNTIVANEVRFGELPDTPQIEPVYYTTSGLSRKNIAKYIQTVIDEGIDVVSYLPEYICDKYNFSTKSYAIEQIHHPTDILSLKKARQRLKYEELFMYLLKIQYLKRKNQNSNASLSRKIEHSKVNKFIKSLSFKLTVDQLKSIEEIEKDLCSKKRMNRLLQGDVGSGKTIVAFIASYINYLSGYQTAFMAPTEILATQHYENALKLFKDTDIKIDLLTSSVSKKKREEIYSGLKNGEIDLIIGTQSLIQEKVEFSNLGLVITDEQHRFGVNQRTIFKNKGVMADVLSMSATPIPRTYALTVYGDMDVSNIKTKPEGRKEVITYFKKEKEIYEVLTMMKKELDLKHQIYVIAPAINQEESDENRSVIKLREQMEKAFGKIAKIGIVHGKLDSDAKNKTMNEFENGKIDILISTTVIEVGVNVPNASMIVIFEANMFGLSTLHQLRGRVGRGDIQSYCILIAESSSDRLKMLEKCNDGFEISEYDFVNRGEGDLFGVRQSGDTGLILANIKRDFKLMLRVKEDVEAFIPVLFNDEINIFNNRYQNILDKLKEIEDID